MLRTLQSSGQVRVIPCSDQPDWDHAVDQAFTHDIYHRCRFHQIAESNGEGEGQLYCYSENEYALILPLLRRPLTAVTWPNEAGCGWFDATSVYGYAGPLSSHAVLPADFLRRAQRALLEALLESRIVCLFSRMHPLIPQERLTDSLGEQVDVGRTVSIDLTLPRDEQTAQFRSDCKRGIRRLRREGVTVELDDQLQYLDDFIVMYYETMRRVGAADYYFFPRPYIASLLSSQPGCETRLFVAFVEGQPACGGLFTACDGIVQYHISGTSDHFANCNPVKLMVDEVREWAIRERCHSLHLGGGLGAQEDSLFYFKTGFSKRRHQFRVWNWILMPELYQHLCETVANQRLSRGLQLRSPDFFPQYRASWKPPVATEQLDGVPQAPVTTV